MAANDETAAARRTGLAGIEDRIADVLEDRRKRAAVFAALVLAAVLVPGVGSNYTLEIRGVRGEQAAVRKLFVVEG